MKTLFEFEFELLHVVDESVEGSSHFLGWCSSRNLSSCRWRLSTVS